MLPRRYHVLRTLGRGAQGKVELAVDRYRRNALVAAKSTVRGGASLLGEFEVLLSLSHANIASVRDFGPTSDGGEFYTSDYVEGGHLLEWCAQLPEDERWRALTYLTAQALSALAYLERRGVIHGDVKPANLLVADGELKLVDFGSARQQGDAASTMAHSGAGGTPAYTPGEGLDHVPRDLYALGMSLVHAGTGRLPFEVGDREALATWHRAGSPARLPADAPPALRRLVERLTAVEAEGQFAHAADALEFFLQRASVAAAIPPRPDFTIRCGARDELIDQVATQVARGTPSVQVLTGPAGTGKTVLLDALVPRLQTRGVHAIRVDRGNTADVLRELRECGTRPGDTPLRDGAPATDIAIDLLYGLQVRGTPVAFLVDAQSLERQSLEGQSPEKRAGNVSTDVDGVGTRAVIAATVERALRLAQERAVGAPSLVFTAPRVDSVNFGALEEDRRRWRERVVEPLERETIAAAGRDFFSTDSIPDPVLSWLEAACGGRPARLLAALEHLRRAGTRCDVFGKLVPPASLPPIEEAQTVDACVDPKLREAARLLSLAGEPLSAAGLHARFPERSLAAWQTVAEALRTAGLCRLVRGEDTPRYLAVHPSAGELERGSVQDEATRRRLREFFRSRHHFDSPSRRPPLNTAFDECLAAARNEVALGAEHALNLVRRVAPACLHLGRGHDLAALCDALWAPTARSKSPAPDDDGPRAVLMSGRRARCMALRAAKAYTQLGRYADALAVLSRSEPDAASTEERFALARARAEAHVAAGDAPSARSALDPFAQVNREREETTAIELIQFEARARLAPLHFALGDPIEGRAALASEECIDRFAEWPDWARDLSGHRILHAFASAESAHGNARTSARLLECSLAALPASNVDSPARRSALNELGILAVRDRQFPRAIEVFEELETLCEARGDALGALRAAYNQAVTHYRLHSLDEAESCFARARLLGDRLGPHALSATLWLGSAGILRERGRLVDALRTYRRVLRARRGVRDADRALAHNNVAEIYLEFGRPTRALEHSDRAVALAETIQRATLRTLTTCMSGVIRWALGDHDEAVRRLARASASASEQREMRAVGYCEFALGRLAAHRGETRAAIEHLRRATTASRRAEDATHARLARLELVGTLLHAGRARTAERSISRSRRGDGSSVARRSRDGGFGRRARQRCRGFALAAGRHRARRGRPSGGPRSRLRSTLGRPRSRSRLGVLCRDQACPRKRPTRRRLTAGIEPEVERARAQATSSSSRRTKASVRRVLGTGRTLC